MSKRKKGAGKITQSGNLPRPGQKGPATIILTQPRRFGIDIADYMLAVRAFENVDYSRRFRLYDLFSDILMDTHLTSVIEKRKNAALASSIEFRRNGKPDEKVNKQIRSPWFRKFIGDILDAKFWGVLTRAVLPKGGMGELRPDTAQTRRSRAQAHTAAPDGHHRDVLGRVPGPVVHRFTRRSRVAGESSHLGDIQT